MKVFAKNTDSVLIAMLLIIRALLLVFGLCGLAVVPLTLYGITPRWQEDVMRSRVPSIFAILAGACVMIFQGDADRAAVMLRIGFTGERNRMLRDTIDRIDRGRSTPRDNDTLIMAWMMTKDFGYIRLIESVGASERGMASQTAHMAFCMLHRQYPQWFEQ